MRIIYVTANFPYGGGEAYLESELSELVRQGFEVLVVPRSKGDLAPQVDPEGWQLRPGRVVSPRILGAAAQEAVLHLRRAVAAISLLQGDGSHLLRNLAVTPKAMWLATLAQAWGAGHIHAHWAGTTATMAMVAAELTGIPWSFTAHRWDIEDGNLATAKVGHASFARVISQNGLRVFSRKVNGRDRHKLHVIHMGVVVPKNPATPREKTSEDESTMICAGNLNEGKGHALLFEAMAELQARGSSGFTLLVAGDGPLRNTLRRKAGDLGLEGRVRFLGHVDHDELMTLYGSGAIDAAVLPSAFEGIPVALMEAMGYGIPVIATAVGGVPELCGGDCGVLIPSGDRHALAEAIQRLLFDRERMLRLGQRGRQRVIEEFAVERTVARLISLMTSATTK